MSQFAARYLCIGLIGTAVCYFATPHARQFLLKDSRIGAAARQRIGGSMQELGSWLNGAVENVPEPAALLDEDVAIQPTPTVMKASLPAGLVPAPDPLGPPASAAKPVSAVVGSRDKRPERWGVVQEPTAKIYDLNGKFLRRIDVGSCVEFVDVVRSRDGRQLGRARIMPNRSGREILVPLDALDIAEGPFADASQTERTLRIRRARVLGQIMENDTARASRLNPANPNMRPYSSIRKKYRAFWQEVEQLKAAAKGPNRVEALDKLREMKGEDIRLGNAYRKAKASYETWERDHPESLAADSRMATLQKQIAEIDQQLRGLD